MGITMNEARVAPVLGTSAVTDDEVAFFRERGYLAVDRPVIPADDIDRVRGLLDELFANWRKIPKGLFHDHGKPHGVDDAAPLAPNVIFCGDLAPELRRTETYRTCRRVAEQLLGGPVRHEFDQSILKPGHSPARTAWHTDLGYKRYPDSAPESVNFWVALQDTTAEMGALRYIPGSHLRDTVHDREGHIIVARDVDEAAAVTCPLPKGGFTIHALRTIHGSEGNMSDGPRASWILHFTREDRGPIRRFSEERLRTDSRIRVLGMRLMPYAGPLLERIERTLATRGVKL